MIDTSAGHLALYIVLAVVAMAVLHWVESRRIRLAPVRRTQLDRRRAAGAVLKRVVVPTILLTIAAGAAPASAHVIQVATSIPATTLADDGDLKEALASAVDDVLAHVVAFTPTVVTLQHARVVGNRLYILLLIADQDGEETLKTLSMTPVSAR